MADEGSDKGHCFRRTSESKGDGSQEWTDSGDVNRPPEKKEGLNSACTTIATVAWWSLLRRARIGSDAEVALKYVTAR